MKSNPRESVRHGGFGARAIGFCALLLSCIHIGGANAEIIALKSPNEESGGNFGNTVSGIPDLNGDGVGDVVVGSPYENGAGISNSGRAYVFSGADGLLLSTHESPNPSSNGLFGYMVVGFADIDGDGYGDYALSGHFENGDGLHAESGRVYLYSGLSGTLLFTVSSGHPTTGGHFGYWITAVPDLDGDSRNDIVVGAPGETPNGTYSGRAYVFSTGTGALLHDLVSPNSIASGSFGQTVAGIPDVDGDGLGDVVIGAWADHPGAAPAAAGRAYIFSGASGALLSTLASPNEELNAYFGMALAGIQDVDGDGRGDVVVGAWKETVAGNVWAGRAYTFSGATGLLINTLVSPNLESNALFSSAISDVGDLDGDAVADLLITSDWGDPFTSSYNSLGVAHILSGSTGETLATIDSPDYENNGHFGNASSGIPHPAGVYGPRYVIAAFHVSPGVSPSTAGRAYIYYGSGPDTPTPTATPSPTDSPTASPTPSPSPTATPDCNTPGDFNHDCCVNLWDFFYLIDHWQLTIEGLFMGLQQFLDIVGHWGDGCEGEHMH